MAAAFHSGGGSKRRRADEEGEQARADAAEDRLSALPEALRLHILGLLPLTSAIRTGALSTRWRALWTRRWPAPSSLDFRLGTHDSHGPLLDLPTRSYQYEPEEEPSESEEELPEEEGPVEELSKKEALEEDELEEELPEGEASEEELLKGEVPEEEQSEEEQSEEDGLEEEPLEDGFPNLMLIKMTNFKGRHNEMQLVSFVLMKSISLNQLILFTPKSDHPEGLHKDHLNASHFLETKLLLLERASPIAQIILSEPDDSAIQPLHWEAFVNV